MLGLKLNHVSKRGPWTFLNCSSIIGDLSVSIIDISSHLIKLYEETDAIMLNRTPQIEMPPQYFYCQYILQTPGTDTHLEQNASF